MYNLNVKCIITPFFGPMVCRGATFAPLHCYSDAVSSFTCQEALVFSHLRATCSISSTVSSFSLGFPKVSPLPISTLSIFSQSENNTGLTPTASKPRESLFFWWRHKTFCLLWRAFKQYVQRYYINVNISPLTAVHHSLIPHFIQPYLLLLTLHHTPFVWKIFSLLIRKHHLGVKASWNIFLKGLWIHFLSSQDDDL